MENIDTKMTLKERIDNFKRQYPENIVNEMLIDVDMEDILCEEAKVKNCGEDRFQVSLSESNKCIICYDLTFNNERVVIEYTNALFDDSKDVNLLTREVRRKVLSTFENKYSVNCHSSSLLGPFDNTKLYIDPKEDIQLSKIDYSLDGEPIARKDEGGRIHHYDHEPKTAIGKPLEDEKRVPIVTRHMIELYPEYVKTM